MLKEGSLFAMSTAYSSALRRRERGEGAKGRQLGIRMEKGTEAQRHKGTKGEVQDRFYELNK